MDNRNMFNVNQTQQPIGFYPYYNAAPASMMRPEQTTFLMPQSQQAAIIKGRPVSSFEEARVAQIDLDGSVSFFPDLSSQKIYTKRINADGTATLNTYTLDTKTPEATPDYATKTEVEDLKQVLEEVINRIKSMSAPAPVATQNNTTSKLNF